MTHAERALLLAVAKLLAAKHFPDGWRRSLTDAIATVEAEAAPEAPADNKSCETCSSYLSMHDKCLYPRDGECPPTHKYWQPKPTEAAVCPTCNGTGLHELLNMYEDCPKCGGKKEEV